VSRPVVSSELVVASWNVLAAPWAAPAYYPAGMDSGLLDRVARRDLVARSLDDLGADLVCLQETTPVDLAAIVAALGDGVVAHSAPNGRQLWAGWTTEELPWETNGTAILWRTERFDDVETGGCPLSDDGNVATTFRARLAGTGTRVGVVSVHLDVDRPELRRAQLDTACSALGRPTPATIDVVAGDCNEDTTATDLGTIIAGHGFADALTAVGNADPTHPLASPSDDYAPLARLDHVLVRGASVADGRVVDAGLWAAVADPGERMIEGLRRTGSDHLAVFATIVPPG
jgi:endonuclease/exonuclease/phosphatase family metal-dependent hydrolase